jgi:hypothetical protein
MTNKRRAQKETAEDETEKTHDLGKKVLQVSATLMVKRCNLSLMKNLARREARRDVIFS